MFILIHDLSPPMYGVDAHKPTRTTMVVANAYASPCFLIDTELLTPDRTGTPHRQKIGHSSKESTKKVNCTMSNMTSYTRYMVPYMISLRSSLLTTSSLDETAQSTYYDVRSCGVGVY